MEAKKWKSKIKAACESMGTYRKEYEPTILALADILESRDKVYRQFVSSGANPVISYTNKGGATNLTKNPLMVSWLDLNAQALVYWRELGLTPAGYKKLSDDGKVRMKQEKRTLGDTISQMIDY